MARPDVRIETVSGTSVEPYLSAAARLRISVFREFPYLYDGDLGYEEGYLRSYAESERSVFVVALSGEEVVGISTGVPLAEADEEFAKPFQTAGLGIGDVFYFGESVLLPAYRGHGLGSAFMRQRELHARTLADYRTCAFCSVQRAADDPRRPQGYRDLHAFWRKYGFEETPSLEAVFPWKEIGQPEEVTNRLRFWLKRID